MDFRKKDLFERLTDETEEHLFSVLGDPRLDAYSEP